MREDMRRYLGRARVTLPLSSMAHALVRANRAPSRMQALRLAEVLLLIIGARIGYGLLAWLAFVGSGPHGPMFHIWAMANLPPVPTPSSPVLLPWQQWDAAWFVALAVHGYSHVPWGTAYQPLYPLLIHIATPLCGGMPLVAALVISTVSFGIAVWMFGQLVAAHWDRATARRAVLLLVLAPNAFFFLAAYSEALFLALSIGTMYLAERHRYTWAGIMAAFACLTRIQGLALLPALAIYACARRQRQAYALVPLLLPSLAAEAAYEAVVRYLWHLPGPAETMGRHWGLYPQAPWTTIARTLAMIHSPRFSLFGLPPYNFAIFCNLGAALLSLLLLIWGTQRLPAAWTVYGASSWIIALSHLESTSRYISVVFPIYVSASLILAPRELFRAVVICSAALLGFLSIAHLIGNFVA